MPQVGNKKFPYTPTGIAAAKKAAKKKKGPGRLSKAMKRGAMEEKMEGHPGMMDSKREEMMERRR